MEKYQQVAPSPITLIKADHGYKRKQGMSEKGMTWDNREGFGTHEEDEGAVKITNNIHVKSIHEVF